MANLITIARILLIAPFVAMFFITSGWAPAAALVIFVIAALSDFLDGWVARSRQETSALGAALDPIADKLLVIAALILLVRNGVIREAGIVAVLIIILREVLISGLREALASRGGALPVSRLGKTKTAIQLVACGMLLAAAPGGVIGQALSPAATGALWLAAVLTLWSGAHYARLAVAALHDGVDRRREGG